ncbi:MAG: cyanophycin synthetase, partial [Candidatus Saccharibacteria bacterium]|nr:cyanophycin synthetase [Candidatus Saccharibacteria bacterium]
VQAFEQFKSQSENVILDLEFSDFKLAGEVRRRDAGFAMEAIKEIVANENLEITDAKIVEVLNKFPGVGRRFERLYQGIYTDYAHHPEEIKATMDVALDEMELRGKKGVVVVYQPHQNTRQHEVQDLYYDAFIGADKIFWLPTYLTREDESLPVIRPMDFINGLSNAEMAEVAEIGDELWMEILRYNNLGYLVILMTAGPADEWLREQIDFKKNLPKVAP